MKINSVKAIEILDSRGNPTIEADVILEGGITGRAAAVRPPTPAPITTIRDILFQFTTIGATNLSGSVLPLNQYPIPTNSSDARWRKS